MRQIFAEALDVHLDQAVVPADALREPAAHVAGPFGAHDETTVVVDALAMAQQDQRILEILRVHRLRMLRERALERIAAIARHAGGDAVVGQALAPDAKRERVFERLEAREEAVRLDHHARTDGGGARLLEVTDEALEIDAAAAIATADANVRIDDHHGLDVRRQAFEQSPHRAGLAAIHAVIEAAPACLAQTQHGVVGGAVADEPDAIAIGRKGIHELIEQRLEIVDGSDDRVRPDRHDLPRARPAARAARSIDRCRFSSVGAVAMCRRRTCRRRMKSSASV